MKNRLLIIACVLICLTFNQAFACLCLECLDKEYISAEQIVISSDGIYVLMNGETVPVVAVAQDAEGIYCVKTTWTCSRCQTVNEWWRTKCKTCRY